MKVSDFRWIAFLFVVVALIAYFSILIPGIASDKEKVQIEPYSTITLSAQNNFLKIPYVNIYLVDQDANCPIQHDVVDIGDFNGFKSGCLCTGDTIPRLGSCEVLNLQSNTNCQTIKDIPKRLVTTWDGKLKVCVRRSLPENFHYKVKKEDKCRDGFKQCSSYFCLRDIPNLNCPYTDYQLAPANSPKEQSLIDLGYERLQDNVKNSDGETYKSYGLRGNETAGDVYFLRDFKVSVNSEQCYNTFISPKRNSDILYPLEVDQHIGCDKDEFGANTAQLKRVASISETKFYQLNNLDTVLPQNFIDFVNKNEDKIVLYGKKQKQVNTYSPQVLAFKIHDHFEQIDSTNLSFYDQLETSTYIFTAFAFIGLLGLIYLLINGAGIFAYRIALASAFFLLLASLVWAISFIVLGPLENEIQDRINAQELDAFAGQLEIQLINILKKRSRRAIEDYDEILYSILILGIIGTILFIVCLILLEPTELSPVAKLKAIENIQKSIESPVRQTGGYVRVQGKNDQY